MLRATRALDVFMKALPCYKRISSKNKHFVWLFWLNFTKRASNGYDYLNVSWQNLILINERVNHKKKNNNNYSKHFHLSHR